MISAGEGMEPELEKVPPKPQVKAISGPDGFAGLSFSARKVLFLSSFFSRLGLSEPGRAVFPRKYFVENRNFKIMLRKLFMLARSSGLMLYLAICIKYINFVLRRVLVVDRSLTNPRSKPIMTSACCLCLLPLDSAVENAANVQFSKIRILLIHPLCHSNIRIYSNEGLPGSPWDLILHF